MFKGEEDRGGAGRDTDLVVDVLHVVFGSTTRNPETPPDLGVRTAFHDELQYLHLAVAQPSWTKGLTSTAREMARVEDSGNDLRVKSAGARLTE